MKNLLFVLLLLTLSGCDEKDVFDDGSRFSSEDQKYGIALCEKVAFNSDIIRIDTHYACLRKDGVNEYVGFGCMGDGYPGIRVNVLCVNKLTVSYTRNFENQAEKDKFEDYDD